MKKKDKKVKIKINNNCMSRFQVQRDRTAPLTGIYRIKSRSNKSHFWVRIRVRTWVRIWIRIWGRIKGKD
jgi:hypothetical protein